MFRDVMKKVSKFHEKNPLYPRVHDLIGKRDSRFFELFLSRKSIEIELFYENNDMTLELSSFLGPKYMEFSPFYPYKNYTMIDALILTEMKGKVAGFTRSKRGTRRDRIIAKYDPEYAKVVLPKEENSALNFCRGYPFGEEVDPEDILLYPEFSYLRNDEDGVMHEALRKDIISVPLRNRYKLQNYLRSFTESEKKDMLETMEFFKQYMEPAPQCVFKVDATAIEYMKFCVLNNEQRSVDFYSREIGSPTMRRRVLSILRDDAIRGVFAKYNSIVNRHYRHGEIMVEEREIMSCPLEELKILLRCRPSYQYKALTREDLNIYNISHALIPRRKYKKEKILEIENKMEPEVFSYIMNRLSARGGVLIRN